MYAVVTTVNVVPEQFDAGRKELQDRIVPRVRQAAGFVRGYWLVRDDHRQGLSTIVFKTKEDATQAMGMVRNTQFPAGVTLASVETREVIADA